MKYLIIITLLFVSLGSFAQNDFRGDTNIFRGMIKTPNIIQKSLDTSNYKIDVVDALGNHYKMYWPTYGSTSGVQTLSSQYTDASNVSTTETDLLSFTLPSNTLVNNGDRVVIEAMFTTPSNGNSKSMAFYLGAFSQTWTSSTIANGATIFVRATIYKTGTGSQRIQIEMVTGYSDYPIYTSSTLDETGTIVIKFSGTGAASNDITQRTMAVTYYPVLAP